MLILGCINSFSPLHIDVIADLQILELRDHRQVLIRLRWRRREKCHRAVTKFIVKGLLPFSTVEAVGQVSRYLNQDNVVVF